jgi:four helix bundle protein
MKAENYHDKLKNIMKSYAHGVYDITEKFPKSEIFGTVSQIRRAALSVLLNYVEGFARNSTATRNHFYKISYGSLKESQILLEFTKERKYLNNKDFEILNKIGDEIGKMLWPLLKD